MIGLSRFMKCEPSNPELYTQMIGMHVKENGRDTGRGWGGGAAFEIARDSFIACQSNTASSDSLWRSGYITGNVKGL